MLPLFADGDEKKQRRCRYHNSSGACSATGEQHRCTHHCQELADHRHSGRISSFILAESVAAQKKAETTLRRKGGESSSQLQWFTIAKIEL